VRLGRCFRFVYIYACIAVFLCCYRFSVNKDLYKVSTVVDVMVLIIASNILVWPVRTSVTSVTELQRCASNSTQPQFVVLIDFRARQTAVTKELPADRGSAARSRTIADLAWVGHRGLPAIKPETSQSFTYKMTARINWHRYESKLRQCHRRYFLLLIRASLGDRTSAMYIRTRRPWRHGDSRRFFSP